MELDKHIKNIRPIYNNSSYTHNFRESREIPLHGAPMITTTLSKPYLYLLYSITLWFWQSPDTGRKSMGE